MNGYLIPENLAVSDTGFLFMPTSGETYILNPTGQYFFKLLREKKTVEDVVNIFLEEYDADRQTLEKDFDDFLSQLKNYQLIEKK